MKKILGLVAGLALSFQLSAQQSGLPTTPVKDINGTTVAFNETVKPGKVTLISFWATWCIPCKKEIKNIKGKLEAWKSEVPDFEYMTVSTDDARATGQVRSYAKSQGWNFPSYQDPNSDLKRSLNFQNVPFTLIVDKEGKIAFMHTGYEEGGEDILFEKVKELAAK
jgi:thiol-disulfide isomerase/thioredoxin